MHNKTRERLKAIVEALKFSNQPSLAALLDSIIAEDEMIEARALWLVALDEGRDD